jgi:crossover junction endodeoxyribonuclease RuvC
MIILGIDPGTTRIGYGVISSEKNKITCLEYGIIENQGQDKFLYFSNTVAELKKIIKKHNPEAAGIERLFFTKNQKTAMAVSEMRGILLFTLYGAGLPIIEFTPLQVKSFISGYGSADKKQVQKMVKLLLNLKDDIRPDDAADALAIAICCLGQLRG